MKKILIKSLIIILIVGIGYIYIEPFLPNYISNSTFKNAQLELNSKINQLDYKIEYLTKIIDTLTLNADTIKLNLDSLKKGQHIIYEQITTKEDFFTKLFN